MTIRPFSVPLTSKEQALVDEHFHRCPNTGDLVWNWTDERMVLVSSDDARRLRAAVFSKDQP